MSEDRPVIRKVKRKGHEGGHGGSWKVAYADFVTAMMAFFLLMWLLAALKPEQRVGLAGFFREFNLFEQGGGMAVSGAGQAPAAAPAVPSIRAQQTDLTAKTPLTSTTVEHVPGDAAGEKSPPPLPPAELRSQLIKMVEERLSDVKDQVLIDVFEGGVKIQMVDKQGRPMFALGSERLTKEGARVLKVIAESIKNLDQSIAIEGHTDALAFTSGQYTNWELSTARASEARKELERQGLDPGKLLRVAGYASVDPLIKEDPNDQRNRRISILIFEKTALPRQ